MKNKGYGILLIPAIMAIVLMFSVLQACDTEETLEETVSESIVSEPETETEETTTEEETEETTVEETKKEKKKTTKKKTKEEPKSREITIAAIGDMLMHPGVSGLAFQQDGSINYDYIFEAISEEIATADIAVVNNEVPFGGDQYGLQNYPNFNVYSALGDAEVRAGFDVILNASNHVLDQGYTGLQNTLDFWKKYPEMKILGVHESQEDQDTLKIIEVDGVRIAMFNYVYGINSYGVPASRPYLVDLLQTPYRDKIAAELKRAEEEADFTIVFPHWGEEYHLQETSAQREWAEFFTENGADLIIGTHPHVLEPVKEVVSANGNTSLCYYSLGNYISMQDETISILGGLAKVTLIADKDGVRLKDYDIQYLVTYYDTAVSYAFVKKLEDFTEDLIYRHGIIGLNAPGNGLNKYYPLALNTFYQVIDEVNGKTPLRVDPEVAQSIYRAEVKAVEEEAESIAASLEEEEASAESEKETSTETDSQSEAESEAESVTESAASTETESQTESSSEDSGTSAETSTETTP